MSPRGWSDWEHGLLQNSDMSNHELAYELGRSVQSVRLKRRKIAHGWEPKRDEMLYWSHQEDDFILSNTALTAAEVGRRLGRSEYAIKHRRIKLAAEGNKIKYTGNSCPFSPGSRRLLARTCPSCGFLLTGSWFRETGAGSKRKTCLRCLDNKYGKTDEQKSHWHERSSASYKRLQEITRSNAENHGKEWTEKDMEVLADPDLTAFQKAITLKRTYASVKHYTHINGFSSRVGNGDPAREQWIIDNPYALEMLTQQQAS